MNFLKMNNKGQLGNLTSLGYGLMILGVILGLSLVVLSEFKSTEAVYNDSIDANETMGDVIDVFGDVVDWLPIIVIVVIIAIILGLLGFGFGKGKR